MAEQNQNVQTIQAGIVDAISADIQKIFPPKDVQILLNKAVELQQKVEDLELKWKAAQAAQARSKNAIGLSKTGIAYQTLGISHQRESSFQYQDILIILTEAELFIDRVRAHFTGQEITFTVGISYYGKLYEYNLKLLDMLKTAVVGIDSKSQGLKLRIAKSKSALISAYGDINTQTRQASIEEPYKQTATNDELYNSLHNYYLANKKRINGTYVNEGELYETYRYYIEKGKHSFDPHKKTDLNFLHKAVSRSMNSISGRKGGDINTSQVKFFNASFATLSNIKSTLKELIRLMKDFIQSGNKENFKKGLTEVFTKDKKQIEDIDRETQKEAKKHIDEVIKTIPGITLT